jgi:phosphomevalonate kinase
MRTLLCISGKRFSGKDTLAACLDRAASVRDLSLASYAFAAESKRLFVAAQASRGVAVDLARLTVDRDYKESWRPQLTQFTVDALAVDPQVFVRAVAARIDDDPRPTVITDLRLLLELDFLRPRYALVVARVVRSDAARARSGWAFDAAKDGHRTETELDDPTLWTVTVDNDGSVSDLDLRATELLSRAFG